MSNKSTFNIIAFITQKNYKQAVPNQDHVIQWLSFVDVLHICFSFIFVRNLGLHCFIFVISEPIIADYVVWVLLIVEDRTVTYNC